MARKPLEMPSGVDLHGGSVRIRFTWRGKRHSEILPLPVTQAGIAAAAKLRAEVVSLAKFDLLTESKYLELFPKTAQVFGQDRDTLLGYTQLWLDSRSIQEGTKNNYKSLFNTHWLPYLALTPLRMITVDRLREVVADHKWASPGTKRTALQKLSTVLESAVREGRISSNPVKALDLPKKTKKKIDPFSQAEADRIIAHLYRLDHWPSQIYGAYFEFAFYTGMRPAEIFALRWDEVDFNKREVHVCRTVALGQIQETTKTGEDRVVLLNDRAWHALMWAQAYIERRMASKHGDIKEFPYCFPPGKAQPYIKETSNVHHHWRPTLRELGIRYRAPYNCRHTYATICLMAGLNPAFIARQLGHSVQMLLSTYAHWIESDRDWAEMKKLGLVQNWSKPENNPSETIDLEAL